MILTSDIVELSLLVRASPKYKYHLVHLGQVFAQQVAWDTLTLSLIRHVSLTNKIMVRYNPYRRREKGDISFLVLPLIAPAFKLI